MEKSTSTVLRGGNGGNAISLTRRFRRGRKFGTILVDLATHKVIDLLPDRTTETAAAWMQLHPEIDIVSRDRGGDYAAAGEEGMLARDALMNNPQRLLETGKPVAMKVARRVCYQKVAEVVSS